MNDLCPARPRYARAAPARPRFITPANPDLDPLPPVVTRATGKPVRHDLGGGWTMTLEPARITAAPGDEVEFSIEPGPRSCLLAARTW